MQFDSTFVFILVLGACVGGIAVVVFFYVARAASEDAINKVMDERGLGRGRKP